jgi:hypothetical protein
LYKIKRLKKVLLAILIIATTAAKAQKIDSIYVNLYTDSLKKGTYNYINVDGLLSNGRYLPLDSTYIQFTASAGKFFGNALLIDNNFTAEKIIIKAVLTKNTAIVKEFAVYIKKKPDDENLKTVTELLNETPNPKSKPKKS